MENGGLFFRFYRGEKTMSLTAGKTHMVTELQSGRFTRCDNDPSLIISGRAQVDHIDGFSPALFVFLSFSRISHNCFLYLYTFSIFTIFPRTLYSQPRLYVICHYAIQVDVRTRRKNKPARIYTVSTFVDKTMRLGTTPIPNSKNNLLTYLRDLLGFF